METEFWSDYYDRIFNSWKKFEESINKKVSDTNDEAKVVISSYSDWSDEQLKKFIDRKIYVIYPDINGNYCEATIISSFSRDIDYVQATGKYGATLFTAPTSYTYKIDGNCVDCDTFIKVTSLLKKINDIKNKDKHSNTIGGIYDDMIWFDIETKRIIYNKTQEKENEDMPKIVDYTYIEHDKVTKIKWSDGSETVVCGSGDDATQFCGYVCAIAKKAMGNNGKMLSEWDRLVIKPVEKAKKAEEKKRLAAEKKAKEERIREEAKAKRMAKNAKYYEEREKKRKQREIEALAEQIAKEYEQDKLYAEAIKLAIEKHKVPCDYFDDDYNCHCGCKEFEVTDENDISD